MGFTRKQTIAYVAMRFGRNIFLSGKAGTGKSFVLQHFIKEVREGKKTDALICAPSGIAAINVSGSTIHRTFHAPLNPIISEPSKIPDVVRQADILIIDEISMVRRDLFEFVIKTVQKENERRKTKNLRNKKDIQIIVCGDFHQLPPVMRDQDKVILDEYYETDVGNGYAFSSPLWDECNFVNIVLDEVMRQADTEFIEALNLARVGDKRCIPYFKNKSSKRPVEDSILLCSTNRQVQDVNERELDKLPGNPFIFYSQETGEVKESDRATERELKLKIGARIMMLTNDNDGKWQNGSLGTIEKIEEAVITVSLDNSNVVEISYHKWLIETYEVIKDEAGNKKLKRKEIGSFTQIPMKLAYAVTMHKSQGMTFRKVTISPSAWAPGQLYVALSRCRSIETMHLNYDIKPWYLVAAEEVNNFYAGLEELYVADFKGLDIKDIMLTIVRALNVHEKERKEL